MSKQEAKNIQVGDVLQVKNIDYKFKVKEISFAPSNDVRLMFWDANQIGWSENVCERV